MFDCPYKLQLRITAKIVESNGRFTVFYFSDFILIKWFNHSCQLLCLPVKDWAWRSFRFINTILDMKNRTSIIHKIVNRSS